MAREAFKSSFGPTHYDRGPGRHMRCAASGKFDCTKRLALGFLSSLSEGRRFTVVRRWAVDCLLRLDLDQVIVRSSSGQGCSLALRCFLERLGGTFRTSFTSCAGLLSY